MSLSDKSNGDPFPEGSSVIVVPIKFETAVRLVAAAGVEHVEIHPAVARVRLGKNAGTLLHWKGNYDEDDYWEREFPAAYRARHDR